MTLEQAKALGKRALAAGWVWSEGVMAFPSNKAAEQGHSLESRRVKAVMTKGTHPSILLHDIGYWGETPDLRDPAAQGILRQQIRDRCGESTHPRPSLGRHRTRSARRSPRGYPMETTMTYLTRLVAIKGCQLHNLKPGAIWYKTKTHHRSQAAAEKNARSQIRGVASCGEEWEAQVYLRPTTTDEPSPKVVARFRNEVVPYADGHGFFCKAVDQIAKEQAKT